MKLTINRLAIQQAFKEGKIQAICGYPGIGKTYLETHNPNFIDGWFSEHYYLDKAKGIVNPVFPWNYIEVCNRAMENGKIILCAMHPKARQVFDYLDMKYVVLYPNESEKERYFNIYDTRPDVREWISLNKAVWDSKIECIKDMTVPVGCFKDEIPIGMNLTEYLTQLDVLSLGNVPERDYYINVLENKEFDYGRQNIIPSTSRT